MRAAVAAFAHEFVAFLNAAWTPFHATAEGAKLLEAAGYEHIAETESWDGKLRPGGKYFFTRNGSAIVAFAVGGAYKPGGGFNIIGAHTDSPCPRLKPISKSSAHGYLQVGVAPYGGGLWHTWFDRDLTVAGRALVRDPRDGSVRHRLVRIDRPIMRIPTLAIHLSRTVRCPRRHARAHVGHASRPPRRAALRC